MTKHIIILLISAMYFSGILAQESQDLDYTDKLEPVENPGIGFYRTQVCHFKDSGNEAIPTWGNISHLRMDISEFSSNAVINIDETSGDTTFGVSHPLTRDVLDAFESTLDAVRQRGKTAVIRFSYDPWFNGAKNCDPSQSVILGHLKQLGEGYSRNSDVIQYVELGMYGSWGEMHSSTSGTNENIAEALQTLLEYTSMDIKIGVRRPDIVAYWLGVANGSDYSEFNIDSEKFQQAVHEKGDTIFRVGMYNDGYLGSDSDLGTVGMGASGKQLTRENMIGWLEKFSAHTPYGGELVANNNGEKPINTPSYLFLEGFRTHTSYLNYEWHQPTILSWKDSTFYEDDEEYNGTDGYTYVENHLGYRFILRDSKIGRIGDSIHVKLQIENVGFGNLTKKSIVSFVFTNDENTVEIPINTIDPMEWLSQNTTEVETSFSIPANLTDGKYIAYIRISEYADLNIDKNYHCIRFGNTSKQYNSTIGANKIGTIKLSSKANTPTVAFTKNYSYDNGVLSLGADISAVVYTPRGETIQKMEANTSIDLAHFSQGIIIVVFRLQDKQERTEKFILK